MATESASAIGHASSWGYACFLTVNATSVWGGIFPFLPLEFQTVEVTLTFFLTQAVAFGGAFLASMLDRISFPTVLGACSSRFPLSCYSLGRPV